MNKDVRPQDAVNFNGQEAITLDLHDLKDLILEIKSMKAHQQHVDEMISHLHKENAKLKFLLEDVIHEIGKDANYHKDES